MIKLNFFLIIALSIHPVYSQELPVEHAEVMFENSNADESENVDDDELMQQLQGYLRHPMNLNYANEEEMQRLRILTTIQIENFIQYRKLLGKLIHIYELQAIPGWQIDLIRRLLPYITIDDDNIPDPEIILERWKAGNSSLLVRVSDQFKSLVRYKHSYRNLLQLNVTTERDAGEKLFDFTSAHFFVRNVGIVKRLAIGDFVISMGQGLIMSQGMSLRKSANVLGIKKQNEILRPYSSSGEYNFHRGIASTIKWKKLETTWFVSFRKLDSNIESDSLRRSTTVTSIITSGYHRTQSEKANRKNLKQLLVGANISIRSPLLQVALNVVSYRFSTAIQRAASPENAFSFAGDRLTNISIYYGRSFMNAHMFGEFAMDDQSNMATLNGLLVSLDRRLDCAFLYRRISPKYRSMYSGSFTENPIPSNENGLYTGCSFRLSGRWRLDAYSDIFRFPFLKYLVPEPTIGTDLFCQLTWTPSRQIEIYGRVKTEDRAPDSKKQFRYQLTWHLSRQIIVRERIELMKRWMAGGPNGEYGYLALTDVQYRPIAKPVRVKGRFIAFETEGSATKLYAYESDVLFSGSVRGYSGRGVHFQLNFYSDLDQVIHKLKKRKISFEIWVSHAQTVYFQQPYVPDSSIKGNRSPTSKTTLQAIFSI
mgnify:CR=1 FL=1